MIDWKLAIAALLAGALAVAASTAITYRAQRDAAQARFDAFKAEQQRLAAEQRARIAQLEREKEVQRAELERKNAADVAAISARYDREFERLRDRARGAGADSVPRPPGPAAVCASQADNDRLFDAFSQFRTGVLELLRRCELQTRTLITAQQWLEAR